MILGTLSYNENSEEGDIELDWENMPEGVVGLDLLSDWIADLTKVYNRELNHVFTTNKLTGVNK
jgi:hypothetical protein